jgi:transcriptional regulator with XRE-family HTH domain
MRTGVWWKSTCFYATYLLEWGIHGNKPLMNPEQARDLGQLVKARRESLNMTRNQLAELMQVRDSTVSRLEHGKFAAPRPDKLARLAEVLHLDLADVFARAGYVVPTEMPHWSHYLRAKYPDLPASAIQELRVLFTDLAARHNVAIPIEEIVDDQWPGQRGKPTSGTLARAFGEDFE